MNIPARYVNGHLGNIGVSVVDPMDFSAWIEVFLDRRWMIFDPRNNIPRIGRVVVARGRDAANVPMLMSFGPINCRRLRIGPTRSRTMRRPTYEGVDHVAIH